MKHLEVFILLVALMTHSIKLCTGNCTQTADEERIYHNRWNHQTKIKRIETICDGVNFPIAASVKKYSCDNCPQTMRIRSSQSTTVPSSSFLEYSTTTELYMQNLKIDKLSPGAFNALQSLEILDLSGNLFAQISIGIFNSLFTLTRLDLSRNNIQTLDSQSLSGMLRLKFLNLSKNVLSDFQDDILDPNINKLDVLDISSNEISRFEPGILKSRIESLYLSDNKLDVLKFCAASFTNLTLSKNLIRSLRIQNCSNITSNLKKLDLSYNEIVELDTESLSATSKLEDLIMHHNNISLIPTGFFSNLHNLKRLNLSNNRIQRFQHGIFETLGNLKTLDLSYNNISDIRRYLHNLVDLSELRLRNNYLVSLDAKQLISDLPKLSSVSIDHNNLTCDNLIEIIHDFRKANINIEYGKSRDSSNIHGISCLDGLNLSSKFEEIIMDKLDIMSNQDFKKSAMYEYFNKDFRNSNFYKYMQNLQELNDLKFNETQIFNYFNTDFENTRFFKYLESMKDAENFSIEFQKSVYEYFNNDFRNSSFVKYLDELKGANDILNGGFSKSNMYKFFNVDFENTQFYKYLESLRRNSFGLTTNASLYEKQIDTSFLQDNSGIIILLTLIFASLVFLLLFLVFVNYKKSITNHIKNEQVELIEA